MVQFRQSLCTLAACFLVSAPAFAIEKYQTNIGPTPLDGSNRPNVLGRGSVQATLDGTQFTVQGSFAGLATAATDAHLCMGNVMGGVGPVIGDISATQAMDGKISGTMTLTPEQVSGLKSGKIYVLLNSQKAAKGNLWGWFQPAHKTVGPNVPQHGSWYLPNILQDDGGTAKKKPQG
jgi:hypothetical protein